jgi:hypothetical protein
MVLIIFAANQYCNIFYISVFDAAFVILSIMDRFWLVRHTGFPAIISMEHRLYSKNRVMAFVAIAVITI